MKKQTLRMLALSLAFAGLSACSDTKEPAPVPVPPPPGPEKEHIAFPDQALAYKLTGGGFSTPTATAA